MKSIFDQKMSTFVLSFDFYSIDVRICFEWENNILFKMNEKNGINFVSNEEKKKMNYFIINENDY